MKNSKETRFTKWLDNISSNIVAGITVTVIASIITTYIIIRTPDTPKHDPHLEETHITPPNKTSYKSADEIRKQSTDIKLKEKIRPQKYATDSSNGETTVKCSPHIIYSRNSYGSPLESPNGKDCIPLDKISKYQVTFNLCDGQMAKSRLFEISGTIKSVDYGISEKVDGPFEMVHAGYDITGGAEWRISTKNMFQKIGRFAIVDIESNLSDDQKICSINVLAEPLNQ